jgi:ABC-2 type transport system permease protein
MPSKAITERPHDHPGGAGSLPPEESPSILREDQPTIARTFGLFGAVLVIFGGMGLWYSRLSTTWSTFFLSVGLASMFFHAAFDRDQAIRRLYLAFAGLCLVVGTTLTLWSFAEKFIYLFMPGYLLLFLSLVFGLTSLRHEEDVEVRKIAEFAVLGLGTGLAVIGLFWGTLKGEFLLPRGLLLALIGLVYLAGFVRSRGISDDLAYWTGLALGAGGLLFFLIALGRSIIPQLMSEPSLASKNYYMPSGLLLMALGLIYVAVSLGLCSDNTFVVLTRRELGAFFFSPVAYLVLGGFIVSAWWAFNQFLFLIARASRLQGGVWEPIVQYYFFSLLPVLVNLFVPPVLTMRLLSEEKRTGTLEVLLTAPVREPTLVLSKFLAGWLMFMAIWIPFGLYLTAIPLAGGNFFDYRPLICFFIALAVSGAGFIAVGLFFSSLTQNQIVSGVFTFAAMLAFTSIYLFLDQFDTGTATHTLLEHMSYLNFWMKALEGQLAPRPLLFFSSLTIFFLFVTVKVLDARKWL